MIYSVFFPVSLLVAVALGIGGRRFWCQLNGAAERRGSFLVHLLPALREIITHERFASCELGATRRWPHLSLLWGFVGAAITSGLLIIAIYLMGEVMPLPLWHPFKVLGNVSAILLVAGGGLLLGSRILSPKNAGATTAFDAFFLGVVILVIASGVLTEVARLSGYLSAGCWLYIVHLGAVMCLFLSAPYSMFAHALYRSLAMVHERMISPRPAPIGQEEGQGDDRE